MTTPTRPLYWSVRRELWENKSIYVAPAAAAAVRAATTAAASASSDQNHERQTLASPHREPPSSQGGIGTGSVLDFKQ